jgi:predicted transcriptional regulator
MTMQQLDEFHRFAAAQIRAAEADLSLEECLRRWRRECEERETVAMINESLADIAAGRVKSLDEVDAEIRAEFGFGPGRP